MLLFAVPGTCGDVSDCLAALPASSATTREVSQTEIGTRTGLRVSARQPQASIVVPADSPKDDIGRLDTWGRIFGIGLISSTRRTRRSRCSRSACAP